MDVIYPNMRREVMSNLVRHIDKSGDGEGLIIYSQLNEANAEDTIHEQVSYFESIGQDFEWKVVDYDKPLDLKDRLGSYGFIVEEVEAIMVLDLEGAPDVLWQPVLHETPDRSLGIEIPDILTVERQVWNEDVSR